MTRFTRARTALILAACLLLAQGAAVTLLGTSTPGPVFSDLIEVAVAGLAVFHCSRASGRSTGLARSFWALAATTFAIAFVDFSLMVWS